MEAPSKEIREAYSEIADKLRGYIDNYLMAYDYDLGLEDCYVDNPYNYQREYADSLSEIGVTTESSTLSLDELNFDSLLNILESLEFIYGIGIH